MLRTVSLLSGLAAVAAQDALCSAAGAPPVIQATGVDLNFVQAEVTCNNLGGFKPLPDEPGFLPCNDEELRYTNFGTDFGLDIGPADNVVLDLVVTNLTSYIPNNARRNGRTQDQTGSFGQVNLADDQSTDFAYRFYETGTNTPVSLSTGIDFLFFDLDVGEVCPAQHSLIYRFNRLLHVVVCRASLFLSSPTYLHVLCSQAGRLTESIDVQGALSVTTVEDVRLQLDSFASCAPTAPDTSVDDLVENAVAFRLVAIKISRRLASRPPSSSPRRALTLSIFWPRSAATA